MSTDLNKQERYLLEWLKMDDGQYGECHGKTGALPTGRRGRAA